MTTYGGWTRGVKSAMRLVTGALLGLVMAVTLGLAGAGSAEAAIALRGSATTATTTSTTLTINKPAGVMAGDIMIVNIAKLGNKTNDPSLTGWTLISSADLGGTTARQGALLYKVATASEGASYTFALGTNTTNAAGGVVAFSGVNSSSPFDVTNGTITVVNANSISVTGLTTATAGAAVVMFGMADDGPTWTNWRTTSPGTLTELYEAQQSSNVSVGAAWALKPATGATGNGTVTLSTTERSGAILVALKPVVADTVAPTVTINQADAQDDPPTGPTINFTVVFSESVTGFTSGDVTIGGTAGGTKTVTVTGSGTTYNVAVSGMTSAGTVIASIAAGVASDAAGNANAASTSDDNTVTLQAYTITAAAGYNGTITPSGATTVLSGGSQIYTITPNSGYAVAEVKVDGQSATLDGNSQYTFSSVSDDHTIAVTFVEQSSPTVTGLTYSCASVGADTVCTFTEGSGTFSVPQNVTAQVLVVGGGGGGGGAVSTQYNNGGGGGAGGYLEYSNVALNKDTNYTVTVGSGGNGGSGSTPSKGSNGGDSVFAAYTAKGGGGGGTGSAGSYSTYGSGLDGGSGGGGARSYNGTAYSGTGGDPVAGQGYSGATATTSQKAGGGGGAGGAGGAADSIGGAGKSSIISGATVDYACGGGGGGSSAGSAGCVGAGAGGAASANGGSATVANRGYAGGGAANNSSAARTGGAGGSGVVIIRFPKLAAPVTDMVTAWPTASNITYGQTLASSTLSGGSALVNGSFAFSAPATVPPAGTADYNVTFTPTDSGFGTVTGSASVTVNAASQTITVSNTATYDGSAKSATVTCSGGGTASSILTGGSATQTNAGDYSVTADCPANGNYAETKGLTAANKFTIAKASPTVTVTVGTYAYDDSAQGPDSYTTTPSGDDGTATWSYAGVSGTTYGPSATKPTSAGSYTATLSLGSTSNFNAAASTATAFTIAKASSTISLSGVIDSIFNAILGDGPTPSVTGSTGAVTYSYAGTGSTSYGPSATRPTDAGTYSVTAMVAADDNFDGATSSAYAFTIAKATPTASVTNTPVTYSGSAQTATVACLGGGAATLASGGTGTNAGSYAATVDCAESSNYAAASGLSAGNFVINKASQTVAVNNSPVTYDGTAKAATVTCTSGASSDIKTGAAASQSAAGTYAVTADCAATDNYSALNDGAAGDFTIAKATPTASLTNTPVSYSGSAQSATAACLGGGTASLASGGTGTNAGSYAATVDCAESSNYEAASGLIPTNGSFVITKATPAVTAWPTAAALSYGDTLVKSALTGGTITPVGATGLFAWTVPTTQPPSGTTTQSVTFTPTDTTNYNTVRNNVSVTVGKGAQAALTITAPDGMTYGDTDADVSVSGGSGSGATSYVVTGSTACSLVSGKLHVTSGTGTCTITATRAADNNYSPQSGTKVVAISKAAQATLAITAPASATFGAADAAITTTGGTGSGTVTFSAGSSTGCSIVGGKLHVTAGDGTCALTATQAADSNYAATTSAAYTVTPGKAASTITVTGSDSYTYNGSPQGPATVSRTGSTGAVTYSYVGTGSTSYDESATAPTNAGSYSVTATVAADGNYAAKTSEAVTFTIAKKAASVTPSNASKVYQVTPAADPTLTGTLNGFIAGDSITASYSRPEGDAAGTYTISAVLSPENKLANYSITYNTADFVIAGAVQTVTFDDPGAKTYGDEPFALSAAASSNLPVTFSSLTGEVCTVSGSTVTIVKAGTCSIRATQAGDGDNLAAASADQSFTVAKADAAVALDGLTVKYTAGAQTPTVTTDPAGKAVTVTYDGSTTAPSAVGSYKVVATIADDNYTGSAEGDFTINPADPVGVTISKAAGLTDLTNSATLSFDVVFTAAVTGVKGSDFTVTAAGSPSVAVTATDATHYAVAITGMSDGDVAISLAEDQVSGLLNNKNLASNAVTVTYDGTPPSLAWTIVSSNGMGTAGSYSGASWEVGGQRDGETGFVAGTAVFQRANGGLNLKTNSFTCDTKWNDVAVKGSGAAVDLAAGNCYRWTFDTTASASAVKPTDAAGNSAAGLTSPLLKVDQADSTTTVAEASGFTTSSAYGGGIKYAATVSAGSDSLANKEIIFYADATTLIGSCTINGANGGCTMADAYTGLSVGSHKITAVFPGSDNYRSSTSAAATHTVAKATATCTVSGWTGTYDAKAHGASGSCTGVGGATLTGLSLGSSFVNVPGGSTAWNFSNPNYQLPESQDTEAERTVVVTISKASVAVYPTEGLSKVFALTPLADPPLTYTTDPAGVTLTGTLARAEGESVGSYFINSGTLASDNYEVDMVANFYEFTIKESTSATPDAVADSYKVDRGQEVSIAAPGVMSNDSDPDNTALTAELVTAPTKALTGGFTFNADGSFSYAHDPAKTGNDSFTYKVHNGGNYSEVVTVTLTLFTASQADQELSIAPDRVLVGAESPDAEGCGPPVTFTVANAGATALNISDVALEDTDLNIYRISYNDCAGTLEGKVSCQVEVKYCPGTSTAPKPGRLVVRSSDPETPALAAFLSNYEDAATTASRSLPPVMESLAMPTPLTAGVKQTWTWSTLGYGDTYQMFFTFSECNSNGCAQIATTGWKNPAQIGLGSYDFTGLQAKRYDYTSSITLPATWKNKTIVIRFYQRSQADAQAGLTGVSQIIPGGLVDAAEYYDNSGRRLVRTVQ